MNGHTPGPWHVIRPGQVWGERNPKPKAGMWTVCYKIADVAFHSGGGQEEHRANTALIAAAPDGLAFAEQFQAWDENPHATEEDAAALRKAAAAFIAKAKGGLA